MAAEASWVVYRMTLPNGEAPRMAVCRQDEWDAMERARPGYHALVLAGIPTESEAELLARGTSGDAAPRGVRRPPTGPGGAAAPGDPGDKPPPAAPFGPLRRGG
jgi:hypothetical protein